MRCKRHPGAKLTLDIGGMCIPYAECTVCHTPVYSELGNYVLHNNRGIGRFDRKDQTIAQHEIHTKEALKL